MKKTVTTVQDIVTKVSETGKDKKGWIHADIKDVPFALRIFYPMCSEWVQRVYVYPRKDSVAIYKKEFAQL